MREQGVAKSATWMAVLVAVAVLFSFALACGMPFAALGALAALTLAPRDALWLAGLGWLANQVIGFGFLGYPMDPMTFAWGIALGVSAIAAVAAALWAMSWAKQPVLRLATAFLAAWAGQQAAVFAASLVLGGTVSAFAPGVVWFIFWTNALAFVVLLTVQMIGARAGLARTPVAHLAG